MEYLAVFFSYLSGAEFIVQNSEHFHLLDLASLEAMLADLPLLRDYKGDYSLYSLSQ